MHWYVGHLSIGRCKCYSAKCKNKWWGVQRIRNWEKICAHNWGGGFCHKLGVGLPKGEGWGVVCSLLLHAVTAVISSPGAQNVMSSPGRAPPSHLFFQRWHCGIHQLNVAYIILNEKASKFNIRTRLQILSKKNQALFSFIIKVHGASEKFHCVFFVPRDIATAKEVLI